MADPRPDAPDPEAPDPEAPRLRVGVLVPSREAVMVGRFDAGPLIDMAVEAEELGFDSLWVGDSPLARPRFDPLVLLAALAAVTRRAALGTAVLLPALRQPFLLAHTLASLDRLSSGRLVLGVGITPDSPATRAEAAAAGVPFDGRLRRMLDTLRTCRTLWTGADPAFAVDGRPARVSIHGPHLTLEDVELLPPPHRPGGPPVWVGGAAPGVLRRAGRSFDGWFPGVSDAARFASGWATVLAEAGEAGRPPEAITPALYVTLNLGPGDAARDEMATYLDRYYGLPFEVIASFTAAYAGDPEGAAAWLAGFVEAGVRHLVLRFGTLGDPRAQMRLANEAVVPAVRRLLP